MKRRKGQANPSVVLITISFIIILTVFLFFIRGYLFRYQNTTSNVIFEFPNSNSPIFSEINKTYLSNEEVIVNLSFIEEPNISSIEASVGEKNLSINWMNNKTASFLLDTTLRSKDSKETKLVTMHGLTIYNKPFFDETNYNILSSPEEWAMDKIKESERIAKNSNLIAFISLGIAFISIILNIIQFSKDRKKERRKK